MSVRRRKNVYRVSKQVKFHLKPVDDVVSGEAGVVDLHLVPASLQRNSGHGVDDLLVQLLQLLRVFQINLRPAKKLER